MIVSISIFIAIISISLCAAVGFFSNLRNETLESEMLAHSLFPGFCAAFILNTYTQSPLFIVLGSFFSALLALYLKNFLSEKERALKEASLPFILATFYSAGVALLSIINRNADGKQKGLSNILIGQANALDQSDLLFALFSWVVALIFFAINRRQLLSFSFDRSFFTTNFKKKESFYVFYYFVITLSLLVAARSVGFLLASSLFILPAASAEQLSKNYKKRFLICLLVAAIMGGAGILLSYYVKEAAAGPSLSIIGLICFFIFLSFFTKKSWLYQLFSKIFWKYKIQSEDALRKAFLLNEKEKKTQFQLHEIISTQESKSSQLLSSFHLKLKKYIHQNKDQSYSLSEKGAAHAEDMTYRHRSLELFFVEKLKIDPNEVHELAHQLEHYFSPQECKKLIQEIGFDENDPHGSKIPSYTLLNKKGVPGYL